MASDKVEIERYVASTVSIEDEEVSEAKQDPRQLRPRAFADYPGQDTAKSNLKIYVAAAKKRKQALDHVLLHGPPGLGKTTLANIIAEELGVPFYSTSGPSIDRPGDLAGILAGLEEGALFFIDEIHRLSIQVEEVLYGAMEDFAIDIVIGQGPTARSVKMDVAPFTLVGATTKLSSLSRPFLNRFGIQERLQFYSESALKEILMRSSDVLSITLSDKGAEEIAKRSRGTPRIANRLLRRSWDFAEVAHSSNIDKAVVHDALDRLSIDECGLDLIDRKLLSTLYSQYNGGPVGIDTLAVTVGEEKLTIEEVYEPFLVFMGFLTRGPRGRSLTKKGIEHVKKFRESY